MRGGRGGGGAGRKPAAWVLFFGGRLSNESYCSRDSLWRREAFPTAVAAHGGGKKAGGLWWWLLGLHGQPLEAAAAAHKEEREKRGKEKEEDSGVILCEGWREYSQP